MSDQNKPENVCTQWFSVLVICLFVWYVIAQVIKVNNMPVNEPIIPVTAENGP